VTPKEFVPHSTLDARGIEIVLGFFCQMLPLAVGSQLATANVAALNGFDTKPSIITFNRFDSWAG